MAACLDPHLPGTFAAAGLCLDGAASMPPQPRTAAVPRRARARRDKLMPVRSWVQRTIPGMAGVTRVSASLLPILPLCLLAELVACSTAGWNALPAVLTAAPLGRMRRQCRNRHQGLPLKHSSHLALSQPWLLSASSLLLQRGVEDAGVGVPGVCNFVVRVEGGQPPRLTGAAAGLAPPLHLLLRTPQASGCRQRSSLRAC